MKRFVAILVTFILAIFLILCYVDKSEASNPISGRFNVYNAGNNTKLIVDTATGVCYLWHVEQLGMSTGFAGGMTLLVDACGNPLNFWEVWDAK